MNKIGTSADLQLRTVRTAEEFRMLENEWNELHRAACGSVFQTHVWLSRWWDIYADPGDVLQLATVWQDRKLVGVLPTYLMTTNLIALRLTQLRFLGISDAYGEYSPIVHPEHYAGVSKLFSRFCAEGLRSGICDTISFFRFSPDSEFMHHFMKELAVDGLHVWFTPVAVPRMLMALPATWEEYFASLPETEQKILKRRTRALMSRDIRLEVITGASYTDADFEDFVRLHTAAWIDEGLPGYYRGSSKFQRFNGDVLRRLSGDSTGRIYFFSKDGIRFAAVQAFFVNGKCCFYLSGMDRKHELAPQSPGKVLLSLVIKKAVEEHCTLFDFQGGKEEYKYRLGGKVTSFSKALVWKGKWSTVKVTILVTLQMVRYFLRILLYEDTMLRLWRRFTGTGTRNHHRISAGQ